MGWASLSDILAVALKYAYCAKLDSNSATESREDATELAWWGNSKRVPELELITCLRDMAKVAGGLIRYFYPSRPAGVAPQAYPPAILLQFEKNRSGLLDPISNDLSAAFKSRLHCREVGDEQEKKYGERQ